MTVAQRIAQILTGNLGVAPEKITPSATLQTLGLTDSLDQIDLGLELEIEFGIDCERKPFSTVTTLGGLEFEIEKFSALRERARAA